MKMIKRHLHTGTYYLNNSGSRWIHYTDGKKDTVIFKTESGKEITRTVLYYESFGNFAVVAINYKGKVVKKFPDDILED